MKMLINGKRVDTNSNATIEILDPTTQELIDTVPAATEEDMLQAIEVAQVGKKPWAALPQYKRSNILYKWADLIVANRDELIPLLARETGKPVTQTSGEVDVVPQIIRGYCEMANHLYGQTLTEFQTGSENDIIFTKREPLGVVGCITPFNYPVELCYHKAAAAIAVGNATIIKPSEENPLSLLRMAELAWEAGVPGDVLQVVTGYGAVVGPVLADSKLVNAISFTGSTKVGLEIAALAAKTLKTVSLELGGNDPFIVFEDADMELAVSEAVTGRVQNAGQTCCAPKRFIVQSSVLDEFTTKVIERLKTIKKGSTLSYETELGSLISPVAAKRVEEQVEQAIAQGAKLAFGGKLENLTHYEPTVLTGVTSDMDIAKDLEVFGPVFPIIAFNTLDEAIEIANNSQFGLNAGVITKDSAKAIQTAAKLEVGNVVINGSGCYRNVDQPHGGIKMSGVGREGICCTIQDMTNVKAYILKNIMLEK
jgi:succinate-semialdehyde dehydrogenase/glutarate-semialdehyde dehydrogenase